MKVCAKDGMPKTTLEITVSFEILGQDYGIEKVVAKTKTPEN